MDQHSLLSDADGVHNELPTSSMKPKQAFEIEENEFASHSQSSLSKFVSTLRRKADVYRAFILRSGPASYYTFKNDDGQSPKAARFSGWRAGILAATIAVTTCFCLEVALLIAAFSRYRPTNGTGILFRGSCDWAKYLTTILLIPVNLIGTVVIASSNYLIQCLLAPTRREVDEAHANGAYVDIGMSSFKNITQIWRRKRWTCLAVIASTLPVHLLLNSVIFTAINANNYGVMVVSSDFLADDTWDKCSSLTHGTTNEFGTYADFFSRENTITHSTLDWACRLRNSIARNGTTPDTKSVFTTLDRESCISRYSDPLDSTTGDVVLVTQSQNQNWATIANGTDGQPLTIVDAWSSTNAYIPLGTAFQWAPQTGTGSWSTVCPGTSDLGFHSECDVITSFPTPTLNTFLQNATSQMSVTNVTDAVWEIESIRSIWNAFDYQYWTIGQGLYWNFNISQQPLVDRWQPTSWLCDADFIRSGGQCTASAASSNSSDWQVTPNRIAIDHCISETVEGQCEVQYSSTILILLICFDAIKVAALAFGCFLGFSEKHRKSDQDEPLTTIGDAITSFLRFPDSVTSGKCLVDQDLVYSHYKTYWPELRKAALLIRHSQEFEVRHLTNEQKFAIGAPLYLAFPLPWQAKSLRWHSAPSRSRWVIFGILYTSILAAASAILIICMRELAANDALDQWTAFGGVDVRTLFANTNNGPSGDHSTEKIGDKAASSSIDLAQAAKINSPQLLFSTLYFMYNAMFTSMMAAREWGKFVTAPQGRTLRVSRPKGLQRSTYWLSVPWSVSLPLITISALMHWLLSRAIYFVKINVYNYDQLRDPVHDITGTGYSPLAIVLVILLLLLMLGVLLLAGQQRLPSGIPVVGTNSRAISGACHITTNAENRNEAFGDEDPTLLPLRWGVTYSGSGTEEDPGHCSLTSGEVEKPIPGQIYA